MANSILSQYSAASALTFTTNINGLTGSGGCVWCAPITTAATGPGYPTVRVFYSLIMGTSAPAAGSVIKFYGARGDDAATEIRTGKTISTNTTTSAGYETVVATVDRFEAQAGADFCKAAVADAVTGVTYTGSFELQEPGSDWQIVIVNDAAALATTTGSHSLTYEYLNPQVQ